MGIHHELWFYNDAIRQGLSGSGSISEWCCNFYGRCSIRQVWRSHPWVGNQSPPPPPDRLGLIKPERGTMFVEKWHLFRKDSINSLDYVVKRWTNVPVKTSVKSVQISIFLWQEVFYMRGKCHCVKVMAWSSLIIVRFWKLGYHAIELVNHSLGL